MLGKITHHPPLTEDQMNAFVTRRVVQAVLLLASLILTAACETMGGVADEGEPVFIGEESALHEAEAGERSEPAAVARQE